MPAGADVGLGPWMRWLVAIDVLVLTMASKTAVLNQQFAVGVAKNVTQSRTVPTR